MAQPKNFIHAEVRAASLNSIFMRLAGPSAAAEHAGVAGAAAEHAGAAP